MRTLTKTGRLFGARVTGRRGDPIPSISVFFIAISIMSLVSSCASARGGLSGRELAAAKEWKPSRWTAGSGSALVVMDMQVGNMPIFSQDAVMANIQKLVDAAEAAGAPVVWVYSEDEDARPGQAAFEIAPPLAPAPHHYKVPKTGTSAFTGTDLAAILESKGVGRLVFCGVSSHECVKSTVAASYYDGWLTVVAKDAHSTPVRNGSDEPVKAMNARWAADRRVELKPASSIRF